MNNDRLQLLIDMFDSWSPERQDEIIELVKKRMQDRPDKELDEQFEEPCDG